MEEVQMWLKKIEKELGYESSKVKVAVTHCNNCKVHTNYTDD